MDIVPLEARLNPRPFKTTASLKASQVAPSKQQLLPQVLLRRKAARSSRLSMSLLLPAGQMFTINIWQYAAQRQRSSNAN